MATLDDVKAEVARNTTVIGSARDLIRSLADRIQNVGTDAAALDQIVTDLRANDDALAAAVAENTPAAPSGEPPPTA